MRSFIANLEADADHDGDFNVPDELLTAYIVDRTGLHPLVVRTIPQHELDKMLLYWHLQNVAEKARERKHKPPK